MPHQQQQQQQSPQMHQLHQQFRYPTEKNFNTQQQHIQQQLQPQLHQQQQQQQQQQPMYLMSFPKHLINSGQISVGSLGQQLNESMSASINQQSAPQPRYINLTTYNPPSPVLTSSGGGLQRTGSGSDQQQLQQFFQRQDSNGQNADQKVFN
jgi:hypothetical protein